MPVPLHPLSNQAPLIRFQASSSISGPFSVMCSPLEAIATSSSFLRERARASFLCRRWSSDYRRALRPKSGTIIARYIRRRTTTFSIKVDSVAIPEVVGSPLKQRCPSRPQVRSARAVKSAPSRSQSRACSRAAAAIARKRPPTRSSGSNTASQVAQRRPERELLRSLVFALSPIRR